MSTTRLQSIFQRLWTICIV